MDKNKCKKCGKPIDPKFEYCFEHKDLATPKGSKNPERKIGEFLLDSYYNEAGKIRRDVYDQAAKGLAKIFQKGSIKISALRRFYELVRSIREQFIRGGQDDFGQAVSELQSLRPKVNYQLNRKIVSQDFVEFIEHNVELASQSPENLEGFHKLFQSIVCYFRE